MRAGILLVAFILLRPAAVAGLRRTWPFGPLGSWLVDGDQWILMGLHHPDILLGQNDPS